MKGRADRVALANSVLKKIASCGRKFFYSPSHDRTAMFVEKDGRLYFMDDHNGVLLPLSHCHSKRWNRYFSHGGTLKGLVLALADYIKTGKLIHRCHFFAPAWLNDGDPCALTNFGRTAHGSPNTPNVTLKIIHAVTSIEEYYTSIKNSVT